MCQLVYVERAEVFKSEDVSFFYVFLSFPLNFGGLTELFMLDRMLQEALHCFNPELVSRSSAVPTWESLVAL